ncbi:zinc finger protein 512-like [Glandiceps talaboti]
MSLTEGTTFSSDHLSIQALYTKPARPVVTPAMTAEWRDILKSEGELKCRNEGCDVSYINVGSMKFHYAMCPKNGIVLENYKCLVCSKEYKSETSMKFHVQSAHQVEVISKQESDSEDDYSDCSESSIDTPDEG